MPTLDEHKDAARAELRRLVQPDTEPKLTADEIEELLDANQRASFWLASTAYGYGDVAQPANKNGHRYVCVQAGTSAAVEPTWPTCDSAVVLDGGVKWKEAGADFANVYDVRAAAHQAWQMKAAKTAELFDHGGQKYSQIVEHCLEMARRLEPVELS